MTYSVYDYNTRENNKWENMYENQNDYSMEEASLLHGFDKIEKREREREREKVSNHFAYFYTMISITVMSVPFIICDLYYASTGETCLWKKYETMNISVYEYLVVNSIYSTSACIIYTINLQTLRGKPISYEWSKLENFCEFISRVFITIWTLVGAMLAWYHIQDSCSPNLDGYMKASIICKFVIYSLYFTYSYINDINCGL